MEGKDVDNNSTLIDNSTQSSTSPAKEEPVSFDQKKATAKPKEDYDMRLSKYEFFCKALATVIAIVAFIFHLLRGTTEGEFLYVK